MENHENNMQAQVPPPKPRPGCLSVKNIVFAVIVVILLIIILILWGMLRKEREKTVEIYVSDSSISMQSDLEQGNSRQGDSQAADDTASTTASTTASNEETTAETTTTKKTTTTTKKKTTKKKTTTTTDDYTYWVYEPDKTSETTCDCGCGTVCTCCSCR